MSLYDYNEFLLEKRIDQISANVEISFGFDVIKTKHSDIRRDFADRNLASDNQTPISNGEMKDFVKFFIHEIASGIASGELQSEVTFVIRSRDRNMSMVISPVKVSGNYWKLIIVTVFRESHDNQLKIGRDQIVYTK